MRLNDREIREALREQALSVPVPDAMWANVSRELDRDQARVQRPVLVAAPRPTHRRWLDRPIQVRQMLAVCAVAAAFWMMVIPSGAPVDQVQSSDPAASVSAANSEDTPSKAELWKLLTDGKGFSDIRRSASEATVYR